MSEENIPQQEIASDLLIGMPKSGKPWKKVSSKSSTRHKRFHVSSWEQKQQKRKERKELKEYMDSLKKEKDLQIETERKRLKDKKKKDELNKFKGAELQLISDSKKVKKWSKKARKQLVKLPSEMFEQLLAKKRKL